MLFGFFVKVSVQQITVDYREVQRYISSHVQAQKKIAGMTLSYHIDVQMNNSSLVIRNINGDVFKTLDDTKHYNFPFLNISIMNQKLGFWGNQALFRIPILSIHVDVHLIFTTLLVVYAYWSVRFQHMSIE